MTLVFTSVTYALKAQRLLASRHIHSVLSRSPAVTAARGCGYGLRLSDESRLDEARSLVKEKGIFLVATVKEG